MQKTYTVIEIYEADFGCEERPEGQETMVGIRLKAEDGEEIHRQEADAELYAKNINEGDKVLWRECISFIIRHCIKSLRLECRLFW